MGPKLLLTKHSRTPFPCTESPRRKGSAAAAPKGMATVALAPLWFKLLASDDYKQIVVYRGKTLVPMCNLHRVASAEGHSAEGHSSAPEAACSCSSWPCSTCSRRAL